MATILAGRATAAQLIGFVVALRAKGETADELSGLLDAVLAAAELVPLGDDLRDRAVDVVGTGGDRSHSINVSTMAALVVAGAGVPVCKHGARGASSQCGTADVLEALGVAIELSPGGRAALRRGGRHRLLLRPALPPGVPVRRPVAPGDRHPDGVQPARPDGQPGAGAPPADRRRRRPLRRADAGVAAGPRLDRRVGRPRRRARRADDDRARRPCSPCATTAAPTRSPSTPSSSGWRRRRTSSSSVATRRTTPRSCGGCSAASAAPTATSSCSTPPPAWSSPVSPPTSQRGRRDGRAVDRRRPGGRALDAMVRVSQDVAGTG